MEGASGSLQFDETGEAPSPIELWQVGNGTFNLHTQNNSFATVRSSNQVCTVRVRDDGAGIPEDRREAVLERGDFRAGRDALDAQATVRRLMQKGVIIDVLGLGPIAKGVGELIVAVLAQVADMERNRNKERCEAGRDSARASLAATGRTHRGKASLGRPMAADARAVSAWRKENGASIKATSRQFGLSEATVKRYCASKS